MGDDDQVKGVGELLKQAAAGLTLFKEDAVIEGDTDAAKKYKEETDAKFKELEDEAAALTGKDNKKARTEKSKEAAALKKTNEYVDAEKICKGLPPKFGHFVKGGSAPAAKEAPAAAAASAPAAADAADDKKDDKKKKEPKKADSAGISPAERKELESLKTDIIAKKTALKETGLSGGQINKNEEVVAMVTRMQELKEKETPGSTTGKKDDKKEGGKKKVLSAEASVAKENLEREIEEYREKCTKEFGYTKKEIAADPDMVDMMAKLKAMK